MVQRLGGDKDIKYYLTEIESGLGSTYSKERNNLIYQYKLTFARQLAAIERMQEKVVNQTTPLLASDTVKQWANRLGVRIRPNDTLTTLRRKVINRYKIISLDNKGLNEIESFFRDIFGDLFISLNTSFTNDILVDPSKQSNDPYPEWFSDRCFIYVLLNEPTDVENFLDDQVSEINEIMSIILPAWTRYSWGFNTPLTGFVLDDPTLGRLDFNLLF
jgi:hypothetical protein